VKFGIGGRLPDVITCEQFFSNRLRFRFYRGSNFGILHWLRQSPLIQCSATARLWYAMQMQHVPACTLLTAAGANVRRDNHRRIQDFW